MENFIILKDYYGKRFFKNYLIVSKTKHTYIQEEDYTVHIFKFNNEIYNLTYNFRDIPRNINNLFVHRKDLSSNPYIRDFASKFNINLVVYNDYSDIIMFIFKIEKNTKFYYFSQNKIKIISFDDFIHKDYSNDIDSYDFYTSKEDLLSSNIEKIENLKKKINDEKNHYIDISKVISILVKELKDNIEFLKEKKND